MRAPPISGAIRAKPETATITPIVDPPTAHEQRKQSGRRVQLDRRARIEGKNGDEMRATRSTNPPRPRRGKPNPTVEEAQTIDRPAEQADDGQAAKRANHRRQEDQPDVVFEQDTGS